MLFVHECDSPVVFLLDCCHAGASVHREQSSSTVVTLAATGFHDVAPVRGKDSFTTFLTEALKRVRGNQEDVTVAYLKTLISADLNNTDKLNSRGISRRVTPDYIAFSSGSQQSISTSALVYGRPLVSCPIPTYKDTKLEVARRHDRSGAGNVPVMLRLIPERSACGAFAEPHDYEGDMGMGPDG